MEEVRLWVQKCEKTHGIHPRLICNFDQVCSMHFEHAKKVLFKPQSRTGEHVERFQKPSVKKMMTALKTSLGLNLEIPHEKEDAEHMPKHPLINADASTVAVDYCRQCRTTTTLSWADGDVGTAYVTATTASMPNQVVQTMNDELKGETWSGRDVEVEPVDRNGQE